MADFEDFCIANWFPLLQTKYFWKGSDHGLSSAALLHPGHFQGPSHTRLVFLLKLGSCPMKGLAFFHCSSISIASEENLCRKRRDWHSFYNKANCLRLPHSVKCLLCCFTTQQEAKVKEAPLQNRDVVIHLFTSSQDSSGTLLLSSFFFLFLQETDTR